MNNDSRQLFKIALIGFAVMITFFALFPSAHSQEREYRKLGQLGATITVTDIWAREATEKDRSTAVFLTLENTTGQDDVLIGASTPYAERADLHNTYKTEYDVLTMRQVEDIPLPEGETIVFKPGRMHIFLVGVKQPLRMGMEFPLTLEFENSPKQHLRVRILSKTDDDIYPAHSLR